MAGNSRIAYYRNSKGSHADTQVNGDPRLTEKDIACCVLPLFHCFGLVMGYINSLTHGGCIVFPSDTHDASKTLDAITTYGCAALLGVPTMFTAQLDAVRTKFYTIKTICTGLAAGSAVPPPLLERFSKEMGVRGILVAYGMTETSPVRFMMDSHDPPARLARGLGKVMPHTSAKVVDKTGNILPRGCKGELRVSGYLLMKGYLGNTRATNEIMSMDESGVAWIHSGDECVIDDQGYCEITGRIKDTIIRGGETIFPREIEDRLLEYPNIIEASVVGLEDNKYGEVVGYFLEDNATNVGPEDSVLQNWVKSKLGKNKVPAWIFWIGSPGMGEDYPKTGSGKHPKHILRAIGHRLMRGKQKPKALL